MSEKLESQGQGDTKLEDILRSIRGIIDDHNTAPLPQEKQTNSEESIIDDTGIQDKDEENLILELTSIYGDKEDENSEEGLISPKIKGQAEAQINRFTEKVKDVNNVTETNSLDDMVNNLMRPLVKEWLDNNLPRIVEKVISEEIRRIIPKP